MLVFLLLFLFLQVPRLCAESSAPGRPQLEVLEKPLLFFQEGEQRLLSIQGLKRFSIGSPLLRALPVPKLNNLSSQLLLLKAIQVGNTDFWVWKNDGSVEHRLVAIEKSSGRSDLASGLRRAISQLQEVEVLVVGPKMVLRGFVHTLAESARIAAILEAYGSQISSQLQITSALLDEGEQGLREWLLREGGSFSSLRLDRRDGGLRLSGSLRRESDRSQLLQKLRGIFPLLQFDIDFFPDDSPIIRFRVFILEVHQKELRSLGMDWPTVLDPAFKIMSSGFESLAQVDLKIRLLESRGKGRLLSCPELVVRTPGEAELFSGGEIPISLHQRFKSYVQWKKFGLSLVLKVSHQSGSRVRLQISSEVSDLNPALGQDHIPGIQSNRMQTQVDARLEHPLYLSGLIQKKTQQDVQGLPWLKDIPVLGALFSSQDYLDRRSELVMILYPFLAQSVPQARGKVPVPRNWLKPQEVEAMQESQDFPWNTLN